MLLEFGRVPRLRGVKFDCDDVLVVKTGALVLPLLSVTDPVLGRQRLYLRDLVGVRRGHII